MACNNSNNNNGGSSSSSGIKKADDAYRVLVEKLFKRCEEVQTQNERMVYRTNKVKKQVQRIGRDIGILKKRLDRYNDNWRSLPMVLPHPKRKIEQKRGPKPKAKNITIVSTTAPPPATATTQNATKKLLTFQTTKAMTNNQMNPMSIQQQIQQENEETTVSMPSKTTQPTVELVLKTPLPIGTNKKKLTNAGKRKASVALNDTNAVNNAPGPIKKARKQRARKVDKEAVVKQQQEAAFLRRQQQQRRLELQRQKREAKQLAQQQRQLARQQKQLAAQQLKERRQLQRQQQRMNTQQQKRKVLTTTTQIPTTTSFTTQILTNFANATITTPTTGTMPIVSNHTMTITSPNKTQTIIPLIQMQPQPQPKQQQPQQQQRQQQPPPQLQGKVVKLIPQQQYNYQHGQPVKIMHQLKQPQPQQQLKQQQTQQQQHVQVHKLPIIMTSMNATKIPIVTATTTMISNNTPIDTITKGIGAVTVAGTTAYQNKINVNKNFNTIKISNNNNNIANNTNNIVYNKKNIIMKQPQQQQQQQLLLQKPQQNQQQQHKVHYYNAQQQQQQKLLQNQQSPRIKTTIITTAIPGPQLISTAAATTPTPQHQMPRLTTKVSTTFLTPQSSYKFVNIKSNNNNISNNANNSNNVSTMIMPPPPPPAKIEHFTEQQAHLLLMHRPLQVTTIKNRHKNLPPS